MRRFSQQNTLKYSSNTKNGFTLVELLVSATIIILCVISIVAMLRKGREIDINDRYRRSARAIVVSEFENPRYSYPQYQALKTDPGKDTTVIIDKLPGGNTLSGTLKVTIGTEDSVSAGSTNVPYIPVTIGITWQTIEGQDSIAITKLITQL